MSTAASPGSPTGTAPELAGQVAFVTGAAHGQGRASALALDGVVEAIESEKEDWFAVGIQWHPASATASGLDIQVFRGLVTAALRRGELAVP